MTQPAAFAAQHLQNDQVTLWAAIRHGHDIAEAQLSVKTQGGRIGGIDERKHRFAIAGDEWICEGVAHHARANKVWALDDRMHCTSAPNEAVIANGHGHVIHTRRRVHKRVWHMQHAAKVIGPMKAQAIEEERMHKVTVGRFNHHGPPDFIMYSILVSVVDTSAAMKMLGDSA